MIEKVMVVPLNYSHRQEGQIQAFEQIFGYRNTRTMFDYMQMQRRGLSPHAITEEFVRYVLTDEPVDWIWMQLQDSNVIQPWGIQKIKEARPETFITHWMGDLRTEVSEYLQAICKITDATLISNAGQFKMYIDAGARRVEYVQIGLDWDSDVLGLTWNHWIDPNINGMGMKQLRWEPPFRVPEVVFIGGYYEHFPGHKLRVDVIRRLMKEGVDVGVVSESGWPSDIPVVGSCHVKAQNAVYRRAKVALSINNFNDVNGYFSDRQIIAMASGTPVVCCRVPGLTRDFIAGGDCMMFHEHDGLGGDGLDEMAGHVKALLGDTDLRRRIGRSGRYRVMTDHSWYQRILELLPRIEAWRDDV